MPNVCKISPERHVISCIWVRRVQIYPGWVPSYCRPLSERVKLATKYLTQKDHLNTLKVCFRRSVFLSQSSKSLSHYQPSCKGGRLYLPNSPNLCPVLCLEPCSRFLTNSHCSKMYVLHLHVQKREPPLAEGEPCVQGLPVTSCCGIWGTGPMTCEFRFHAFSNFSNSGYLKHKRNWSEDRMYHRIHGQTKELAWGKIGARENSGNQGS